MSVRKRNEFLDGDESDEEQGDVSSSDEEGRGAIGGNAIKRRKIEDAESGNESYYSFASDDDGDRADSQRVGPKPTQGVDQADAERFALSNDFEDDADGLHLTEQDASDNGGLPSTSGEISKQVKTPKSVAAAEKAARKSGVLYITRVPPFMKPQTLRHYLQPHASKGLGRIFLTPEDHASKVSRVKKGGNKKKSYTDGWVEFVSKTEAKLAAEMLNGQIMGGRKGSFYYDDLWNVRYLKGFKWSHLTEQISNENAERAARLREEVRKTRKENKRFLEDVERGKMLNSMENKAKGKQKDAVGSPGEGDKKSGRTGMDFKQKRVQAKNQLTSGGGQSAELQRVLGKIF